MLTGEISDTRNFSHHPMFTKCTLGEYLVNIANRCECHAANLVGIVGTEGPLPEPNLTPVWIVCRAAVE